MIVSIHQPNYLPWLGYFYKIYASDVFVFHDAVAFSKSSYTKRSRIRKAKSSVETTWLSVPVKAQPTGSPISEILINNSARWYEQHWRKIENTYSGAPFFNDHAATLYRALCDAAKLGHLAECNQHLIHVICKMLAIHTPFTVSGGMELRESGSELNLAIVLKMQGSVYLAGGGSRKYESASAFHNAGIALVRHHFGTWLEANPYDQQTTSFVSGLSVIDALMHIGSAGIAELFQAYKTQAD